ncbi:MAG: N-acetyltransferase [Hyphomonadaceae bacterium]|nr:N-acetyltransferase [Hyphomonadaceae bacterium]
MTKFRDNAAASRFELETPDGLIIADYRDLGAVRSITHVETPATARGKGHAGRLMDAIVAHARAGGPRLRASCSYAVAYFERTPDALDVLG